MFISPPTIRISCRCSLCHYAKGLLSSQKFAAWGSAVSVSERASVLVTVFDVRPVVSLLGAAGTGFRVDYTDDLDGGPWLRLTNGVLSAERQEVINFTSTNRARRFYRTVVEPYWRESVWSDSYPRAKYPRCFSLMGRPSFSITASRSSHTRRFSALDWLRSR